jgi:hypothetical protein
MSDTDNTNIASATWNWGGNAFKIADTPLASIVALINRGATHIHGSETSSAVTSDVVREAINAMDPVPVKEARKAAEDAIRTRLRENKFSKSPEFAAKCEAVRAEFLAEIFAGTLGDGGERGPRLSPLEAEMALEARNKVKARLVASGVTGAWGKNGTAFPKPDYVFTLDNGTTRTWSSFIEGYMTKFDAELRKSAQATLDRKARESQKLAEQAAKAGGVDF